LKPYHEPVTATIHAADIASRGDNGTSGKANLLTTIKAQSPAPWRRFLAPGVIVGLMGLAYFSGLGKYLSIAQIAENRDLLLGLVNDHYIFALVGFAALYCVAVALSFPGASIMTIAGGFLFGWLVGGLSTVIAATIGATILFQIARSSFGDVFNKRAGPFLAKINEGFSQDAFSYLLFLRLVPLFPFWLVNIAPAMAKVKLSTYVTTTFLGIIPGTFAFAFVGAGLDSIITAQKQAQASCIATKGLAACPFEISASSLITKELLIAFCALGLVSLIPVVLKKWKARS
jgi:uncharacterized membrane protein YdjX (TVP38/TMEM64 family)